MRLRLSYGLLCLILFPLIPAAAHPPTTDVYGDPLPEGAIGRLGTMRFRHGPATRALAFAADDKVVVSGAAFGCGLRLWESSTGRPLYRVADHSLVICVAVSPGGNMVATGYGNVIVADVATAKEMWRYSPPAGDVFSSLAFSPEGQMLAAVQLGDCGVTVLLLAAKTGKEIRRLDGDTELVQSLAFSPDGKLLVTGGSDKVVRLWEVAAGKEIRAFAAQEKEVQAVAFALAGKVVVTLGYRDEVRLWDTTSGKLVRTLKGDGKGLATITVSRDGKWIAGGGQHGMIYLWDAATGNALRSWQACSLGVRCLAFSADGKRLASAGLWEHAIQLWDTTTGQAIHPTTGHTGLIQMVKFAADGKTLYSFGADRKVLAWELATGKESTQPFGGPLGPENPAIHMAAHDLTSDGKILAWAGKKTGEKASGLPIHLWDTQQKKDLLTLKGTVAGEATLRFTLDGRKLASCGEDGIYLWDVATGKQLHHLPGPPKVLELDISPDGTLLAYAAADRTIRLWNMTTHKEVGNWKGLHEREARVKFSPDGKTLVTIADHAVIQVYAADTGDELRRFQVPGRTDGAVISRSGRVLAAIASYRQSFPGGGSVQTNTIYLWDILSGEEIRHIDTHQGWGQAIAFAPDDRALASGGGDSTILFWDLTGGVQPRPLTGPELIKLWADLGSSASKADRALWTLAKAPQQSVAFLKEQLRPAKAADPKLLARLLGDLDGTTFTVRQQAIRTLEELGEAAEAALHQALAANPTLEVRKRLEQLLQKRGKEIVRQLRAIEALEQAGTAEARHVLEALAKISPSPRIVAAASGAIARLASGACQRPA